MIYQSRGMYITLQIMMMQVTALTTTVEHNCKVALPSSRAHWACFMKCVDMCHQVNPRFDMQEILVRIVDEMPSLSIDTCVEIYRHAGRLMLDVALLDIMRAVRLTFEES